MFIKLCWHFMGEIILFYWLLEKPDWKQQDWTIVHIISFSKILFSPFRRKTSHGSRIWKTLNGPITLLQNERLLHSAYTYWWSGEMFYLCVTAFTKLVPLWGLHSHSSVFVSTFRTGDLVDCPVQTCSTTYLLFFRPRLCLFAKTWVYPSCPPGADQSSWANPQRCFFLCHCCCCLYLLIFFQVISDLKLPRCMFRSGF